MEREEALERIEKYLMDKRVTLWQSWDIHQPSRRREAAEFIYDLIKDVQKALVE